jgi:hypothetical protein
MAAVSKIAAAELLIVAVLLGCQPKPKAPALIDEPVFQSDEGFRFLVPEGWLMSARANVPSGPLEKERLLVQYRRTGGDNLATLEVSVMDLPEDTDMVKYLSAPSFSAHQWKQTGKAESMEAGGAQGTRFRFRAPIKGGELAKEVTVFRRGGRVYFFTVLFSPKDAPAAEQVRRSLGSLVWSK